MHRYPPPPALTGRRLDLGSFARATRFEPELVRRLVALGVFRPERDPAGRLWFPPAQLVLAARIRQTYGTVAADLLDRASTLRQLP